jgi:hypothetical protein
MVSVLAFSGTFLIVVSVQVALHGDEAFEHDAGADFALSMLSCLFAVPVALACFALTFHRLRFKRWSPSGLPKAQFRKI